MTGEQQRRLDDARARQERARAEQAKLANQSFANFLRGALARWNAFIREEE